MDKVIENEDEVEAIISPILHPDVDLDYPDIESAFEDELPNCEKEELELLKAFFTRLRSDEFTHEERLDVWERVRANWYVGDEEGFLGMLHLFEALVELELAKR